MAVLLPSQDVSGGCLESLLDQMELESRWSQAESDDKDGAARVSMKNEGLVGGIQHTAEGVLVDVPLPTTDAPDQLTQLRSLPPSLALIHQTPTELLIRIFHDVSHPNGDFGSLDYADRLHILAQVCSAWATIIRATPSLWTLVQLDDRRSNEWTTTLHRAKTSGFGVRWRAGPEFGSPRTIHESFWSAVVQHSARWKSLRMYIKWSDSVSILETLHTPHLEELFLLNHSYDLKQLTRLCANSLPRLTTLNLTHVTLTDWSSLTLTGLHDLTLFNIRTSGPSLTQMLNILRACPGLSSLRLEFMRFEHETVVAKSPPVELRNLQKLRLDSLNPGAMTTLLRHFGPSDCLVNGNFISGLNTKLTDAQLGPILSFVARSTLHHFATAKKVMVNYIAAGLYIYSGDQSELPGFTICYLQVAGDRVEEWIGRLIESKESGRKTPLPELSVSVHTLKALPGLYRGLSRIQSLNVGFPGATKENVDSFLRMMSKPARHASGSYGWQFAGMESLVLKDVKELDAYLVGQMLECRAAAAAAAADTEAGSVARLERFAIIVEGSTLKLEAAELESGKVQLSVENLFLRREEIIRARENYLRSLSGSDREGI
ncbi:hypothetical protein FRB97_003748 [Tulasnella sp. 331]|nr:hypothetical protein FRB97_003748 [Tulasnella sp. 331]